MSATPPSAVRRTLQVVSSQPPMAAGSVMRPPQSEQADDKISMDFRRLAGLVAAGVSIPLLVELLVRLFGLGPD